MEYYVFLVGNRSMIFIFQISVPAAKTPGGHFVCLFHILQIFTTKWMCYMPARGCHVYGRPRTAHDSHEACECAMFGVQYRSQS